MKCLGNGLFCREEFFESGGTCNAPSSICAGQSLEEDDEDEKDIARKRLTEFLKTVRGHEYGFCVQCGIVKLDEDTCCVVCGALAYGAALENLLEDLANAF